MQLIALVAAGAGLCYAINDQQPIFAKPQKHLTQPSIGFGTWGLKGDQDNITNAVKYAISAGYRQIDGAAAYGNEVAVGKGIAEGMKANGLAREQIWVTSKLWNDHHDGDRVEAGLNKTLEDLDLTYLDLYLMHWPVGKGPDDKKYHYDYVKTWHQMSKLLKTGRVKHIGVSNFSPAQLKDLVKHSDVKPAVHQFELHPYLPQTKFINAHKKHGIAVTAYSPLGNTNPTYGKVSTGAEKSAKGTTSLLENKVVTKIAEKRGCSPAQVVLSWGMERGVSVIPKSAHENHIKENFLSIACALFDEDFDAIAELGEKPTRFNNPSKQWGVHLFEGLDDA